MRVNVARKRRRWLLPLAICVLTVCGMMSAVVTSPRAAYAAPQGSVNDAPVTFNDPSVACAAYQIPSNAQVLEVVAVGGAGQNGQDQGGTHGSGGHGGQVTAYIEVSPNESPLGVQVGGANVITVSGPPLGLGGEDSGPNANIFGGGASGVAFNCNATDASGNPWPVVAGGGGAGGDGSLAGSGGGGGDGCAVAVNAPAGVSCAGAGNGANHVRLILGNCGGGGGGSEGSDTAGGDGGSGGSGCVPADGSKGGAGSFMQGGSGGANHGLGTDGGGGGGGFYGGGGGGGGTDFGAGGGGGGGDSYVSPSSDLAGFLGSATPQIEPASGTSTTGSVTITPIVIDTTADGAAATTSDTSVTLTAHAIVTSPSPAPGTVNDGTIGFTVNGNLYTGPVDSSGTATVTVPLTGFAAGTYTVKTAYNLPDGSMIGGSENTGTLFVVPSGVNVGDINSATASNSTATATTGTPSGGGQPDISATVTGTGTVTVADYSADPVSSALPTGGSYFDVFAPATDSTFTSATIVRCNVGTSTTAYWWNGTSWVAASPQSYDPGTGCITVGPLNSSSTSPTTAELGGTPFGVTPTPTTVTVSPETVKFSQTTPLSATVAVSSPYQAVSTASIAGTVDFTLGSTDLGSVSVSSATGANSVTANLAASPVILQTPSSSAYTITATYTPSSGSFYDGSSGTGALTVIHDDSALAYTGPVVIANGQPATLSATMTGNGVPAQVSGRTLTFTLGSGGSAQQCTATTTSSGVGTCTITKVSQPVGPGGISVNFAGDADYLPSSTSASAIYYSYASAGGFVVGDKSVGTVTPQTISTGPSVTFWSPAWSAANALSGGVAPTSFKGYETSLTVLSAGATWTAAPGNSSSLPKPALPAYLGVIVTSKVTQPGSTITGTVVHVVVVHITSAPNGTGSVPGVGTVVATAS